MTKINIPFAEWRPDIAHLDTQFASEAKNVFRGANSYQPIAGLSQLSTASMALASAGNDSSTKILLHFSGADGGTTITDDNIGGSAHTWTAAGNANTDDAQYKFLPTSLSCDGTGDWVTTNDSSDFTLGSTAFTIECWVRPAVDGTQLFIAGQGDNTGAAATTSFQLEKNSSNKIVARVAAGAAFTTVTATTSILSGSWFHVAFVRTGNTLKLFINGTQEGGDVSFSSTVNDSANAFRIGAVGEFTTNPWNGWIDEFRLSSTARWTTTFTPSTVPYFEGGACRGLYIARTSAGVNTIFAGTAKRLLTYDTTAGGWRDVTRISGGNYALPNNDWWSFEQSGTKIVAVNVGDAPQVIDVDSITNFAALGGSPPQAYTAHQVGDFLVLSGLSSNKRKIQWSAVNDITGWTVGTNLSDTQEFPDGAEAMGIAGGEVGLAVQGRSIRSMQFLPGDTDRIFAFSRIEKEKGAQSRYGWAYSNNTLFFMSEDGFYSFGNGGLNPIGFAAVNSWFNSNSDFTRRNQVVAFVYPAKQRVMWAFYNGVGSTSFDRLLIYDWALNAWSYAVLSAQFWAPFPAAAAGVFACCVGTDGTFYYLGNGSNLAPLIETAEVHPIPGMRAFVNEVYPIVDAVYPTPATVTVGAREWQADSVSYGSTFSMESNGTVPVLASSKLMRFRVEVASAVTWTHARGVLVNAQPDGEA